MAKQWLGGGSEGGRCKGGSSVPVCGRKRKWVLWKVQGEEEGKNQYSGGIHSIRGERKRRVGVENSKSLEKTVGELTLTDRVGWSWLPETGIADADWWWARFEARGDRTWFLTAQKTGEDLPPICPQQIFGRAEEAGSLHIPGLPMLGFQSFLCQPPLVILSHNKLFVFYGIPGKWKRGKTREKEPEAAATKDVASVAGRMRIFVDVVVGGGTAKIQ